MSNIEDNYLYTEDHEWVLPKENSKKVKVGITDFAQSSLGDITFVELPEIGFELKKGQSFGSVESVKAVSDLYAPINGKVISVNEDVINDPAIVNSDPYKQAWMLEVEISSEKELQSLLNSEKYRSLSV